MRLNTIKTKISIITVVKNGSEYLEETIQSVLDQTYSPIEYIIVDGDSTDNSLEIINKYDKYISKWISEPDHGIYDAMNKGISLSTGAWINFMNAGDQFVSSKTIEDIYTFNVNEYDVLYGDCVILYDAFEKRKRRNAQPLNKLWKGMVFSHQSMFIKANLQKNILFNINNKIGADFELIYKLFHHKYLFHYVRLPVSVIRSGGISDKNRLECAKTNFKTVIKYHNDSTTILYYVYFALEQIIKQSIKRLISQNLHKQIIKTTNKYLR